MSLAPGQTIDRYVVERRIGRGGMAEVFAVRHRLLGTRHALKVLLDASEDLRERLLREGRVQASLDHPNVVPVRDVFDVEGAPALLLPFVSGPSLSELIGAGGFELEDALALFRAVVTGVAFVHAHGLVHRDVKASNVLVEIRPDAIVPRVADFGLVTSTDARFDQELTRHGIFVGTPAYAAPEQLRGERSLGPSVDVWALGVLLHVLLTESLPYDQDDVVEMMRGRAPLSPLEPERLRQGLEPRWSDLVRTLCAFDPAERPADGRAILARLDALACSQRLEARQLSQQGRLYRKVQAIAPVDGEPDDPDALAATMFEATASAAEALSAHQTETIEANPGDVPAPLDSFIGRDADTALVQRTFHEGARLVTLVGPAGVGKTRLSVELGRRALGVWPGGVWFVDASATRTAHELAEQIWRVTGGGGAVRDPAAAVVPRLRERGATYLILDQLEHLPADLSALLARWRRALPDVRWLCTSRRPLGVEDERIVRIQPLTDSEGARDATALFVARAKQSKARFELTEENAADVRAIVEELDGLPLAIELAAARMNMLTPAGLRERLGRRFALLVTRSQPSESTGRQRTLRGALDESWDMLTDVERDVVMQLSVFGRPATLQAIEQVVSLEGWQEEPFLIDVLASLVDKSWINAQEGDAPRYGMLVSMREYAAATFAKAGALVCDEGTPRSGPEAVLMAQRRHAVLFATRGEALVGAGTSETMECLRALVRDRGELEAAAGRVAAWRAVEWVEGLAMAISALGIYAGPAGWADALLGGLLDATADDPEARAVVLMRRARLRVTIDHVDTRETLEEATKAAEQAPGKLRRQVARVYARYHLDQRQPEQAWALLEAVGEALDTFDLREEQAHERLCGIALMQLGRQAEARETLEACLRDAEWERDRYAAALISSWLCGVCYELGEYADALQYIDDAIVFARNEGNRLNEARYHRQRGMILRLDGRSSEGLVALREAVRLQRIVNPDAVEMFILHASLCALDVDCAEEARSLYASWDLRPVHKVNALWMVRALAGSCVVFAALGDERGHRRAKRRTLHALGFTDLPAVRVQVQAYLGRAAWLLGDEASARACAEAARAEASALASRPGCVELFELRWLERALGGGEGPARI